MLQTLIAALLAMLMGSPVGIAAASVHHQTTGIAATSQTTLDTAIRTIGPVDTVDFYVSWTEQRDFPVAHANDAYERGAVPTITWQPWNPNGNLQDQPKFSNESIIDGSHNAYIRRWAREIAAWGHPLTLRFMHEGNGNWYPWASQVNGNSAASYVSAYRHVVRIFRRAGASNVRWDWNVNQIYTGSTAISPLYPGNAYVDEVSISGYNWGNVGYHKWETFAAIFAPTIADLDTFTHKRLVIAETGTVQHRQAQWLRQMFRYVHTHHRIRNVTYFDLRDTSAHVDWRVKAPAAERAFRRGVRLVG